MASTTCIRNVWGGGKNRLLKLYITYWITLIVFVGLGSFMKPDVYPGTWTKIIENATAFHTTYNGEAWFLFPYVLLSLTSPILFKIVEHWNVKIVLPIVFVLEYIALFLTSRYYDIFFATHHSLYHIVLYFNCLYSFIIGTYFCKYSEKVVKHEWQKKALSSQPTLVAAFIILFFTNCLIHSAAFGPFYQPAIAFLFIHINWYKPIEKFFQFLGKYSTVVWLVHTWFCYYLFKNFIYGLHYPMLILIVELALSLVAGFALLKITKSVFRLFRL